jgi:hypothetical protein
MDKERSTLTKLLTLAALAGNILFMLWSGLNK